MGGTEAGEKEGRTEGKREGRGGRKSWNSQQAGLEGKELEGRQRN